MKKIKKVKYTGILNQPIVLTHNKQSGLGLSKPKPEEDEGLQYAERLVALFEHFGIKLSPDVPYPKQADEPFTKLAWALAISHVPGFQTVNDPPIRRGRPSKWKGEKGLRLLADVWSLQAQHKKWSARTACSNLITLQVYKREYSAINLNTLYRQYLDARNKYAPASRKPSAHFKDKIISAWASDPEAQLYAGLRTLSLK